jgi:phage gp29-like protein
MARGKELGTTGRSHSARFQYTLATDEYLNTLIWPKDIEIYNKMERSDAQVKAVLQMLELPIRSTSWYIKPADNSSQAKKIAEFVEENLFTGPPKGMAINFDDFIKEICTMFTYGHSVFEKVYEVRDGFLRWKKFATRPQSTLYDFLYDDVGNLEAVEQYLINRGWLRTVMPADKLLVFTHDMKQGDYRGRSALRAAYKHWSIKDFLYKITNIGIERNLVGTPIITLPDNYDDGDYERAKAIVTKLRSNEFGGVTLPPGFLLDLFEGKRTLMDVMPYIDYQDLLISRSTLTHFMNLGGGKSGGSYALSSDQSEMFLMMLGAIAKQIANTINSYAIPQLVQYNFASDLYPTLSFKALDNTKILEVLKLMVDGKLVLPDRDLEEWLRDMMELPEKAKGASEDYNLPSGKSEKDDEMDNDGEKESAKGDTEEEVKEEDLKIDDETDAKVEDKKLDIEKADKTKEAKSKESKQLAEPKTSINFSAIDKDFDKLESKFKKEGKEIILKQLKDLSRKVRGMKIADLATVQVSYKGAMTAFITKLYKEAFAKGVSQVQKELNVKDDPKVVDEAIRASAAIVANNISERVKTRFLHEYLNQIGIEENIEKRLRNVMRMVLG